MVRIMVKQKHTNAAYASISTLSCKRYWNCLCGRRMLLSLQLLLQMWAQWSSGMALEKWQWQVNKVPSRHTLSILWILDEWNQALIHIWIRNWFLYSLLTYMLNLWWFGSLDFDMKPCLIEYEAFNRLCSFQKTVLAIAWNKSRNV